MAQHDTKSTTSPSTALFIMLNALGFLADHWSDRNRGYESTIGSVSQYVVCRSLQSGHGTTDQAAGYETWLTWHFVKTKEPVRIIALVPLSFRAGSVGLGT